MTCGKHSRQNDSVRCSRSVSCGDSHVWRRWAHLSYNRNAQTTHVLPHTLRSCVGRVSLRLVTRSFRRLRIGFLQKVHSSFLRLIKRLYLCSRKYIIKESDPSALQRLLFSVVVLGSPLSIVDVLAIFLRYRRQRVFFSLRIFFIFLDTHLPRV